MPYPVGMQSSEIPDSFLAELPGTRAKILTMDSTTRRYSMLLQLPSEWDFTTGGAPDKSTELYVLEGTIELGEFTLDEGGYAYLPPGSLGVRMKSNAGALLLYYIDDVADGAVIQTPIISNSNLINWRPSSGIDATISTKELRFDPGSGARTWLVEIPTGATEDWESTGADQEGFMISGQYSHDECVEGIAVPTDYLSGVIAGAAVDAQCIDHDD